MNSLLQFHFFAYVCSSAFLVSVLICSYLHDLDLDLDWLGKDLDLEAKNLEGKDLDLNLKVLSTNLAS